MEKILIEDYNYPLPDERIAKYPLAERDASKLLVYKNGQVEEHVFREIGNYLPADAHLIYNNTRVIQARLVFHKRQEDGSEGARIEVFCLGPIDPSDYALSLGSVEGCVWKCMIGNLKKWKTGALQRTIEVAGRTVTLSAERLSTTGNTHEVRFRWNDTNISFAELLDALGELPIPPYLNRPTEESDKRTYQTVYSRIKGSVAAPTAGLHFTDRVLSDLLSRGIGTTELTLHVGAGTFQSVKTEDANEHTMHTEIIAVPRQAIEDILTHLGHIVAVGTTSVRTLESLYYIGEMLAPNQQATQAGGNHYPEVLHVPQFVAYEKEHSLTTEEALRYILRYLDETGQGTLHAETQIMIEPGFRFRIVEQMITNFHQPKSTLLLLVSAFVGGDWQTIYRYALAHDFRFLSYGDSSLLYRGI